MKAIKRNSLKKLPATSTAALPDIVFILLFFFMTVATIKNQDLRVENQLPLASETEKINKADRVIEIFVGRPTKSNQVYDDKTVLIQIDEHLVKKQEVGHYALQSLHQMPEHLRNTAIVAIKADRRVPLVHIKEIKKQLVQVNLLKINYTTLQGDVFQAL
ncbi:MAG: ExbD/TolR family protein [Croceivirga sp.]